MEQEIWKDVKGYEGRYQVSNHGRLKALSRNVRFGRHWNKKTKETILKVYLSDKGYVMIRFYTLGKKKCMFVHRLVAIAFIHNPETKPQVNHIDGNKTNNCVSNLEWATGIENMRHAHKNGLIKHVSGANSYNKKRAINIITNKIFDTWLDAYKDFGKYKYGYFTRMLTGNRRNKTPYRHLQD